MQKKFKVTINNNGLSEKDRESVMFALKSKTPQEALARAEGLLKKSSDKIIRLSYYAKLFLKALAISAEDDIAAANN